MALFSRSHRDPFWDDGAGARRRNTRLRATSLAAFVLATTACGIASAMWVRILLPLFGGPQLG
jgi:hypothetical protein